MTKKNPRYLIFSDLDGTLLNHETYAFHEAQEALDCLKEKGFPLILCSSKTRAEMEGLRKEINNKDPFIVENGAAVFIPKGLFDPINLAFREIDDYQVIELGVSYQKIRTFFEEIKAETGIKAEGFSEMAIDQIARSSGLTLEKAALAKQREYSEPFILPDTISQNRRLLWEEAVQKRDLQMVKGGRFFHLIGPNDKGKAVQLLKNLYSTKTERSPVSIGLGDSPNDFPMLENVDIPVLIKKKANEYEPWPRSTPIYRSREIGPKGWNTFILNLLKEDCHE